MLTAVTAVAALALGAWLFGLFGDGRRPAPTEPEAVPGVRFERPN